MFEGLKQRKAIAKARDIAILISDSSNEILQKSDPGDVQLTHEHIAYMWAWFEVLDDLCFHRDPFTIKAIDYWLMQVAESSGREIGEAYAACVPLFYEEITDQIDHCKNSPAVAPMLATVACDYLRSEDYTPDMETVLSVMKSYTLKVKK